jgi:dihydrofolate reductase
MSVDRNWAIGKDNDLLIKIDNDLQHFKQLTEKSIIIMGRKTLESLPKGKPLPNRVNVVFSRTMESDCERGLYVAHNVAHLERIINAIYEVDKMWGDDTAVNIIGGESLVTQLMPLIDTAVITKIDAEFEADRHIPNLDLMQEWELVSESEPMYENDIKYTYCRYKKNG